MERPGVGVGVFIFKDQKILFGKRKNAHGEGSWSLPGGRLEFNEELEDCARREVMEETGIRIKNIRFGAITNDMFKKEGIHHITVFMLSDHDSGEAETKEPEKCEKWEWFEWGRLPEPLFLPVQNLVKRGYSPFRND